MDNPTTHFQRYVSRVGGRDEAAQRLGISVGMVGHILCGRRGISTNVAKAIEADTDCAIPKGKLRPDLWGDEEHG